MNDYEQSDLNNRLAALEAWKIYSEQTEKEASTDRKEMKLMLNDIKTELAILSSVHKNCPAIAVASNLEPRVRLLEDNINKALGGFKAMIALGSIIGTLVGWAISYFFKH